MKKLNNKGFAISTIIYGLAITVIMIVAILMATMAQTRTNSKKLAEQIEEELNRFSKTETTFLPKMSGNKPVAQEYIVPEDGWYKIELWGSKGAGNGGNGAYTSGVIGLQKGEVLFFYVGSHQNSGNVGRETDVRILSGAYDDFNSYETRIMVAAGGGTGADAAGGTLYGYNANMKSYGGYIDVGSSNSSFGLQASNASGNNTNGTLVGYTKNFALSSLTVGRKSGSPSPIGTNGGGDGYLSSNSNTTGGTSFIAGYGGCYGMSKGSVTEHPLYEYHPRTYAAQYEGTAYSTNMYQSAYNEYYFVDGLMLAGVNSGNGHAQIERVVKKTSPGQTLAKKNTKLNNVRYIRDCVEGATDAQINAWPRLVAVSGGYNYNDPYMAGLSMSVSNGCRTYDLGQYHPAALDEIVTFHNAGVDPKNATLKVSPDNNTWYELTGTAINGNKLSTTETVTGIRVSAYQYDSFIKLPSKGNYIIFPVLYEGKALTAASSAEQNANPITAEYYNGYKRQKWSIEQTETSGEYKITELARYKALTSAQDENIPMNYISATDVYNKYARNEPQIWNIDTQKNGTYTIKTVVPAINPSVPSGLILPQSNQSSDKKNQLIIGKNNYTTARFVLFSVDYSTTN